MTNQYLSYSFTVDQSPQAAFDAINNVAAWWTNNLEGASQKQGDEFSVRFGDVHYSKHRLVTVIPFEKIVWLITDSQLNFVKNKTEWTGTQIIFDISTEAGKTLVHFTHVGLDPGQECYAGCSNAWKNYVTSSLYKLITEGKGTPTLQ